MAGIAVDSVTQERKMSELAFLKFRYISIPIAAAVVGWFTKMIAIKMMFHPIEFRGIHLRRMGLARTDEEDPSMRDEYEILLCSATPAT